MFVNDARNVEDALIKGMGFITDMGHERDSRNGPVYVMPEPVTTVYREPRERVVFLPERNCNPYFHFMESLWMLAGRNDVEFPARYAASMANFSDDGLTFHGAYGYRWRNAECLVEEEGGHQYAIGSLDQLATIAQLLKQNKDDRRIVLQMWNADIDLGREGKDFPCNLICTFRVNPAGHLDMTVFNRSNDLIWGAYGANAVHFSVLQEVMAAWIGVPVGAYWQISTNFHAYKDTYDKHVGILHTPEGVRQPGYGPYTKGEVQPYPIVNGDIDRWFGDLNMFMTEGTSAMGYKDPFFKKVVIPMQLSWEKWKDGNLKRPERIEMAIASAENIAATDWRKACIEWMERKQ